MVCCNIVETQLADVAAMTAASRYNHLRQHSPHHSQFQNFANFINYTRYSVEKNETKILMCESREDRMKSGRRVGGITTTAHSPPHTVCGAVTGDECECNQTKTKILSTRITGTNELFVDLS